MLVQASRHHRQLVKCTLNDRFVLRVPVSVVFFYRRAIPQELIIRSLKEMLVDFPVFAGSILFRDDQLYIDCNNQGVLLNTTRSPRRLSDDFPQINFADPIRTKKGPVLTIKLNYYTDGMAIGYTWHHSIGDMATFMEFVRSLSLKAKNQPYPPPVILEDRNEAIRPKKGNPCTHLKYLNLIDLFYLAKEALTPKKTTYVYFTHEEIAKLRDTLSNRAGYKISRNTALSAHLIHALFRCGADRRQVSIVVNLRSRLHMVPDLLGNFVDTVQASFTSEHSTLTIAENIHQALENYRYNDSDTGEFIRKAGGMKKIARIMPKELLPQEKNFLITSWTNFGVYSVDFGVEAPFLFLPVGKSPLPWVSSIVEGFDNKGLLLSLMLPSTVTRQFCNPAHLAQLHRFRFENDLLSPDCLKFAFS